MPLGNVSVDVEILGRAGIAAHGGSPSFRQEPGRVKRREGWLRLLLLLLLLLRRICIGGGTLLRRGALVLLLIPG